jgi:2-polyprenyl-3-methyl-5-hydroxy-6-metoxy-1,4-benzoquinol methylase
MDNIINNYIQTDSSYHTHHPNWENFPGEGIEGGLNAAHAIRSLLMKNQINIKIGGMRIGDVGCGAGHVLNSLLNILPDTFQYYGYDISPTAITLAKKYERDRLQFFCHDLFDTDQKFDVLISIYVVEHIPNYYEFLTQCKKHAEYKIIVFPMNMNVISVMLNRPRMEYEKAGHLHFFNEFTAIQSMRNCGYEIIDYSYLIGKKKIKTVLNKNISWKKRLITIPRTITAKILSPSLSLHFLGGGGVMVLAR